MTPNTTAYSDDQNIQHDVYTNWDNGTNVELYTIQKGEHIWLDFNADRTSTNELIWKFVSRYNIYGVR
jgi:poly(3-hydroxybutyrate) depolymerase